MDEKARWIEQILGNFSQFLIILCTTDCQKWAFPGVRGKGEDFGLGPVAGELARGVAGLREADDVLEVEGVRGLGRGQADGVAEGRRGRGHGWSFRAGFKDQCDVCRRGLPSFCAPGWRNPQGNDV